VELDLDTSDIWSLCKHGIGLSILMLFLIIGWAVLLMILVAIGSILGLLIGLALLALALGFINSFLAEAVWDMDTDSALIPKFFHGVLLFVILLLVNLPWIAITYYLPHWSITMVLFIIYVPIHGYVGVRVAGVFETVQYEEEETPSWVD